MRRLRGRCLNAVGRDGKRMLKCRNWRRSAEDRNGWWQRIEMSGNGGLKRPGGGEVKMPGGGRLKRPGGGGLKRPGGGRLKRPGGGELRCLEAED